MKFKGSNREQTKQTWNDKTIIPYQKTIWPKHKILEYPVIKVWEIKEINKCKKQTKFYIKAWIISISLINN